MKSITIKIKNMTCSACAVNIERELIKARGINKVNVNFVNETASVEYNESLVHLKSIHQEIEKLGYKVKDEKKDFDRLKLTIALFIGLIIFYLAMGPMMNISLPNFIDHQLNAYLQLFLTSIIVILFIKIWQRGILNLYKLKPNMDSLIFIGTFTAYFYSLFLLNTKSHLFFESTAFILIFIGLGKYLEKISKNKSSQAVKQLIQLQANEAIVLKNGKETIIPIADIIVGDIIIIKPGDKIPVDGTVLTGNSAVDEKMLSGESMPVDKKANDLVKAGTINQNSVLTVRASKVGKDTLLSQIIKTIETAMNSKAPIQKLADKISYYFVPSVILIALSAFSLWLLIGQPLSFAITILISVLIIACPCALGLATPTAIMMGTGLAAKQNILIKNGEALQKAHKIDTIVFDKTGTLTYGEPSLTDVIVVNEKYSQAKALQLAVSLESHSKHPLASAFMKKAKQNQISLLDISKFENISGLGLKGSLANNNILIGTRKLMNLNNIDIKPFEEKIAKLEDKGKTCVMLSLNNQIIALFGLFDELRSESFEVIENLKKEGKEVIILSGDNNKVVKNIATQLNIEKLIAEILPQDKYNEIKKLQFKGQKIAMVGDGINDAPALVQADIGIALNSGTDIAMETGDIILMKSDLNDVRKSLKIAKYSFHKIKQNLFWAFIYNSLGIPVAAGILFPLTGKILSPELAALAMTLSSLSVVLNSLSMKYKKFN